MMPENPSVELKRVQGDFNGIDSEIQNFPMYIIAIASDRKLSSDLCIHGFESDIIDNANEQEIRRTAREEATIWMQNSWSYKIGNILLMPFKLVKKFL